MILMMNFNFQHHWCHITYFCFVHFSFFWNGRLQRAINDLIWRDDKVNRLTPALALPLLSLLAPSAKSNPATLDDVSSFQFVIFTFLYCCFQKTLQIIRTLY